MPPSGKTRTELDVGAYAGSRRYQDLEGTIGRAPRRQACSAERSGKKKLPWPVCLFLISLAIPWVVTVGPVSLSIPRVILLAMVLPCLAKWIGGAAGRIRAADIALLLFCLWSALGLVVVQGPTFAVEPAGILFIETMGAYLLADATSETPTTSSTWRACCSGSWRFSFRSRFSRQ